MFHLAPFVLRAVLVPIQPVLLLLVLQALTLMPLKQIVYPAQLGLNVLVLVLHLLLALQVSTVQLVQRLVPPAQLALPALLLQLHPLYVLRGLML